MVRNLNKYLSFIVSACLWAAGVGPSSAQEVVAVLSSKLRPYVEAYEGFQEAPGRRTPAVNLSEKALRLGGQTRLVVAFGGKAAQVDVPQDAMLVYCMAPGTRVDAPGRAVKVVMVPRTGMVITRLREIQPGMKRLAVFWVSDAMGGYLEEIQQVCAGFGIKAIVTQVSGADALPDRLRAVLQQGVDALWLPPDPLLINAQNFSVLKTFCWSNNIPFYAPTAGLVEQGAVASVSSSFREIGRAAGRVARRVLLGKIPEQVVYPDVVEVTLNLTAAANSKLQIPQEVRLKADRVLP